jgi:hypothetical protein
MEELLRASKQLDPYTVVLYLEVPRSHVLLLQVFFELYDGVGTVRTVQITGQKSGAEQLSGKQSIQGGVVCIITSPANLHVCTSLLKSIREHVPWRLTECDNDPFMESVRAESR